MTATWHLRVLRQAGLRAQAPGKQSTPQEQGTFQKPQIRRHVNSWFYRIQSARQWGILIAMKAPPGKDLPSVTHGRAEATGCTGPVCCISCTPLRTRSPSHSQGKAHRGGEDEDGKTGTRPRIHWAPAPHRIPHGAPDAPLLALLKSHLDSEFTVELRSEVRLSSASPPR